MNTKKQQYIQPELTIVRIQVEKGFVTSGSSSSPLSLQHDESAMEDFGFRNGWSDGSDGNNNSFWN